LSDCEVVGVKARVVEVRTTYPLAVCEVFQ
jgi:hypothetical protein